MLKVDSLSAWYGEAQALRDVSLDINAGEIVTLVGRNGAGKTTLLRSLMGLHKQAKGGIVFNGADISKLPAHERARRGLGYVPDDRGIYAKLSVEENLRLPPRVGDQAFSVDQVYTLFPRLGERRRNPGSKLSGGEQQMLAIARVLRMGATILLLDEPTEGLAPVLVRQVGDILKEAQKRGLTILLIEQNLRFATSVADRHYLLVNGEVVDVLSNAEVQAREGELLEHLGV